MRLAKIIVFLFLFTSPCFADTHYMATDGTDTGTCGVGNACLTLDYSFTQMAAGDTLEIASGTYTESSGKNVINTSNYPPKGISKASPTIVKAATDGAVFMDGENTTEMFTFLGTAGGYSYMQYWKFQGIQWIRSGGYGIQLTGGTGDNFTTSDFGETLPDSYITFKNCGFHSNLELNSVQVAYMKHILFEDCWTWGNGRYGYNLYLNDYIVIRRNVDRRDAVQVASSYPSASYINYASHYVSFQNCISIDTDSTEGWDTDADSYGGFYVRNSYSSRLSDDTHLYGSMVINYNASGNDGRNVFYIQSDPTDTSLENCLILGSSKGIIATSLSDDVAINHCSVLTSANQTAGTLHYAYYDNSGGNYLDVTNSCAVSNSFLTAFSGYSNTSDYNGAYGNSSNTMSQGTHNVTNNPSILYPVRIESGSSYDGKASDLGDIGATILYKYGTDGTFYGDENYATITVNPLWDYPNQALIKTAFSNNYGDSTETRGFCSTGKQLDGVSDITLTSYIWEYLGNELPEDYTGEDTTAPTFSSANITTSGLTSEINWSEAVTDGGVDSGDINLDCSTAGDNVVLTLVDGDGTSKWTLSHSQIYSGDTCTLDIEVAATEIVDSAETPNSLTGVTDQTISNGSTATLTGTTNKALGGTGGSALGGTGGSITGS
jgi:hypothetical protein